MVIGFIFTHAVKDQLSANLYHEQKYNFADRHLKMAMQLLHDHGRLCGNIHFVYVLITIHFVLFYRKSKLSVLLVVIFMVLTTKVNFGFSAGISDKCLQCICDVSACIYPLKIRRFHKGMNVR